MPVTFSEPFVIVARCNSTVAVIRVLHILVELQCSLVEAQAARAKNSSNIQRVDSTTLKQRRGPLRSFAFLCKAGLHGMSSPKHLSTSCSVPDARQQEQHQTPDISNVPIHMTTNSSELCQHSLQSCAGQIAVIGCATYQHLAKAFISLVSLVLA